VDDGFLESDFPEGAAARRLPMLVSAAQVALAEQSSVLSPLFLVLCFAVRMFGFVLFPLFSPPISFFFSNPFRQILIKPFSNIEPY
jgi:hypothetical protein